VSKGDWNLALVYENQFGGEGKLTATVYSVDSDGAVTGTKLAEGEANIGKEWGKQCGVLTLKGMENQIVLENHMVALQLSYSGDCTGMKVFYDGSRFSCSRLKSSAPVPELSTILLFGSRISGATEAQRRTSGFLK
jgi:hypothetical protein